MAVGPVGHGGVGGNAAAGQGKYSYCQFRYCNFKSTSLCFLDVVGFRIRQLMVPLLSSV